MATTTAIPNVASTFAETDGQKNFCPRVYSAAHRMSRTAFAVNQECYGTDPVQRVSVTSALSSSQTASRFNRDTLKGASRSTTAEEQQLAGNGSKMPTFKRSWKGVIEIVCNVLGTGGFVVGSLLWCLDWPVTGTYLFALSCLFCAISCFIYTVKFYLTDDLSGAYALLQQTLGCLIFIAASFAYLEPALEREALAGFLVASLLFLTGCALTQIQCRSWCGVLAPLYPQARMGCLPTSLCNSIGSACFVVGSLCLYYPSSLLAGCWLYEIGSVLFFIASWGDATVWWNMGCTQSEHQDITEFEAGYANVKYL